MYDDIRRKNCIKKKERKWLKLKKNEPSNQPTIMVIFEEEKRTVQTKVAEVRCASETVQNNDDTRRRGRDLD